MPSRYAIACRQNAPASTCQSCLGPMAFHKSGLCTHCDKVILIKENPCKTT